MNGLPEKIRAAARKQGIGVEALRVLTTLSPDTFYRLLRGEEPRTLKVLRKLQAAGVRLPRNIAA